MNCPAHLSSVTKPKLRGGPCSDPRGQPLQPENGSMYAKRSEFQQLRRYFNLLSSRLTPESGQKWLGVLSEPLNLWTTKVSHFFAMLFDTPTSAATKMFPVCHGCGATVTSSHIWVHVSLSYPPGMLTLHWVTSQYDLPNHTNQQIQKVWKP